MSMDRVVYHTLSVTGPSTNRFDEAVKNAIRGAWENHHNAYSRFVSFEAVDLGGQVSDRLELLYQAKVHIQAIHRN